jgi:hypothetical protein
MENNIIICNNQNEQIGTLYKCDINEEGETTIYVMEYYDEKLNKKRLKYTSSKKEYEEYIKKLN